MTFGQALILVAFGGAILAVFAMGYYVYTSRCLKRERERWQKEKNKVL